MPSARGMVLSFTGLTLMTALFSTASAGPLKPITDFSEESDGLEWFVVNDDVMGGKSSGGFEINDGALMVNPYDVTGTAQALHEALTMPDAERRRRAALLAQAGSALPPTAWFGAQLAALH